MNDWTAGYRAALADIERLAASRGGLPLWLGSLLADMRQDTLVIEHEQTNRLQKRRMRAAQEALPLFKDDLL
jgi:hypothetical protein